MIFFKCTELSNLSSSGKSIGYGLMQLEVEFCTAGFYYWEKQESIVCDIWVVVLIFKRSVGEEISIRISN